MVVVVIVLLFDRAVKQRISIMERESESSNTGLTGIGGDNLDASLIVNGGKTDDTKGESSNSGINNRNSDGSSNDLTMDNQEDDVIVVKNYNQLLTDLSYNADVPSFHAKTRWEQMMKIPKFTKDKR